jgi:hypothetical protein
MIAEYPFILLVNEPLSFGSTYCAILDTQGGRQGAVHEQASHIRSQNKSNDSQCRVPEKNRNPCWFLGNATSCLKAV